MRRPDPATWRKEVHHTSPWLDARTPRDWRCPGCSRSKFETVRWCERSPNGDFPAGFRLLLARHHDHAASEVEIIDGRDLAAEHLPHVPITGDLSGHKSFFDSGKAERMLGWKHPVVPA